jgi:RNA polymerase sigma factor (sigma-70 family)
MFTSEQRNQLVVNHIQFAEKIASRQHRRLPFSVYLEDVKSAAYLGLVDAASRYKGNIPFEIFASFRINGEIKDYLRSLGWGTRNNRWQSHAWEETYDYASEPEEGVNDSFEMVTGRLGKQGQNVLRMYFVEDLTMKEIAERVNLSQTRVFQIIKISIADLKETWADREHELWQAVAG